MRWATLIIDFAGYIETREQLGGVLREGAEIGRRKKGTGIYGRKEINSTQSN